MANSFDWWCKTAVSQIRYGPDHDAVYRELYAHLEDLYDDATDRGLPPSEARQEALQRMGSASELAPQLGAIHRPWLGYLLDLTKWCICLVCVALAIQLFCFARNHSFSDGYIPWYYENPGEPLTVYGQDGTWEARRILDCDPDCRGSCDGFTFDVSRAVMSFHDDYADDNQDAYYFHFQVEVTSLFQWAELDDIPIHDFWAVDSLGNTYSSYRNDAHSYQKALSGNLDKTGYFTCTMDMWINNFCSQDTQWIEIRYDRDGRDLRLRIDLNGGDGA